MRVKLISFLQLGDLQKIYPQLDWKKLLPHLSYTFAVEKISRACSHQLIRHRVASFSQQSQRYITVKKLNERVVIPPSIKVKDGPEFNDLITQASEVYQNLVEKGIPKEDARFVLPNAAETSLLMTMNGKSLFHFFGLRCCNRAQWEIRSLADIMLNESRSIEPELFKKAGPYCYQLGYCPEGRFTCGAMRETIEKYRV
jgi:thymidylate synthase (FAD)